MRHRIWNILTFKPYGIIWVVLIFFFHEGKTQNVDEGYTEQSLPKPIIVYKNSSLNDEENAQIIGPARLIALNGRMGINVESSHTRLQYKQHNFNSPKGTFSVWLMSLESLASAANYEGMKRDNENYNIFPVITDLPDMCDYKNASFSFFLNKVWHPGLTVKFIKGLGHHNYNHAAVTANYTEFEKYRWYHLTIGWDFEAQELELFINGIKVGNSDITAEKLIRDKCGEILYAGNPTFCLSEMKFYDEKLSNETIYNIYRQEVTDFDTDFEKYLKYIYTGTNRKEFSWQPDTEWKKEFDISFLKSTDLDSFYIQGYNKGHKIVEEGLLVETPDVPISPEVANEQMYMWSKKSFEGDLYLEFEFKSLKQGGLSLLMTQATGMQREDFMNDYPLRTEGNMGMVAWSSVKIV